MDATSNFATNGVNSQWRCLFLGREEIRFISIYLAREPERNYIRVNSGAESSCVHESLQLRRFDLADKKGKEKDRLITVIATLRQRYVRVPGTSVVPVAGKWQCDLPAGSTSFEERRRSHEASRRKKRVEKEERHTVRALHTDGSSRRLSNVQRFLFPRRIQL